MAIWPELLAYVLPIYTSFYDLLLSGLVMKRSLMDCLRYLSDDDDEDTGGKDKGKAKGDGGKAKGKGKGKAKGDGGKDKGKAKGDEGKDKGKCNFMGKGKFGDKGKDKSRTRYPSDRIPTGTTQRGQPIIYETIYIRTVFHTFAILSPGPGKSPKLINNHKQE